ncbi:MAG TPA: fumarylacetoacetate hydrolase family protein [Acidimicrobiia bacterium]|nr:fumarylacetoacetate hydrolase family protein [Acidimicrobiia bacterium]
MKLVSYALGDETHLGILDHDEVVDLSSILPDGVDMVDLIGLSLEAGIPSPGADTLRTPLSEVSLLAPVRPRKNVFAIGKNYIEHVRELPGADARAEPPPERPIVFSKPPTAIIGPGQAIDTSNDPSSTTDYEGELAVVIGAPAKKVEPDRAMEHVFGYTIVNDVTARALQRGHGQWLMGKGPDTFCPIGPCLVTADEVPDVTALTVETSVSGELRQQGSLADLVFDIPTLISTLSAVMTLEPGDVIATGTPSGVGAGFDPPRFLVPGDVVTITVDPIGTLTNPVT